MLILVVFYTWTYLSGSSQDRILPSLGKERLGVCAPWKSVCCWFLVAGSFFSICSFLFFGFQYGMPLTQANLIETEPATLCLALWELPHKPTGQPETRAAREKEPQEEQVNNPESFTTPGYPA